MVVVLFVCQEYSSADLSVDYIGTLSWRVFFFSSRRRHTRYWRDWSSDVCSSDLRVRGPAQASPSRVPARLGPAGAHQHRPPCRPPPGVGEAGAAREPGRAAVGRLPEIGRASGRERGEISVGAVSLKKKTVTYIND